MASRVGWKIADTSSLTDADWAVINQVKRAYREVLKDVMAKNGVTMEDLRDMVRKVDPPPTKH
jgi:ribosome-interacting GTPase 1